MKTDAGVDDHSSYHY